jgi:hypothetical protein
MDWSKAREVLKRTKTAPGYELVQLARGDVPRAVASLCDWYPEIAVGAESCHLTVEFFYDQTTLAGESDERPIFPVIAKHGDDVAGMMTFERNAAANTITCRVGAVARAHRGSGLALLGPMLLESIGRAIGAELAYYFATLKTPHQQVLAERMRYELVGIVPAFDRSMVRAGEIMRVYEAMYAKVLVGDEAVEAPSEDDLTARTRAVWQALFGARRAATKAAT